MLRNDKGLAWWCITLHNAFILSSFISALFGYDVVVKRDNEAHYSSLYFEFSYYFNCIFSFLHFALKSVSSCITSNCQMWQWNRRALSVLEPENQAASLGSSRGNMLRHHKSKTTNDLQGAKANYFTSCRSFSQLWVLSMLCSVTWLEEERSRLRSWEILCFMFYSLASPLALLSELLPLNCIIPLANHSPF